MHTKKASSGKAMLSLAIIAKYYLQKALYRAIKGCFRVFFVRKMSEKIFKNK